MSGLKTRRGRLLLRRAGHRPVPWSRRTEAPSGSAFGRRRHARARSVLVGRALQARDPGPRWVRTASGMPGPRRAPAVTAGKLEPQVTPHPPPQPRTANRHGTGFEPLLRHPQIWSLTSAFTQRGHHGATPRRPAQRRSAGSWRASVPLHSSACPHPAALPQAPAVAGGTRRRPAAGKATASGDHFPGAVRLHRGWPRWAHEGVALAAPSWCVQRLALPRGRGPGPISRSWWARWFGGNAGGSSPSRGPGVARR
jgi:hypothetical protein